MPIPNTPTTEEIRITPGEGEQQPYSSLAHEHCDPLAFLYLLPACKFGYRVGRDLDTSPVKYFNQ